MTEIITQFNNNASIIMLNNIGFQFPNKKTQD